MDNSNLFTYYNVEWRGLTGYTVIPQTHNKTSQN